MPLGIATAGKRPLADFSTILLDVCIERFPRLIRQFELDGPASFLLTNNGTVYGVAALCNFFDADRSDIAAAQLAVDRKIKDRQIADTLFELQLGSNGPNVFWAEEWFRTDQLALVPRLAPYNWLRDV